MARDERKPEGISKQGIAEALARAFPPDAAADAAFDKLIQMLGPRPGDDARGRDGEAAQ